MDEFYAKCPSCQKRQRQEVLRLKEGGMAIVKCSCCGTLHYAKPVRDEPGVMLMISKGGIVQKAFKKFATADVLKKGGVVEYRDTRYEIKSVESKDGKHLDSMRALDARNVYLAPFTKKISISVHQADGKTASYKIEKGKDEEIKLGDRIKIGKKDIEATRISIPGGEAKKAKVADILALTARTV